MTVDELRKAIEGVPGDMEVLTYDEGYLTEPESVSAGVVACAVGAAPGGPVKPPGAGDMWGREGWPSHFRVIREYSHHPEGTVGKNYFLIC